MSVDPLQYLPIDRWPKLQQAFKMDWPRGLSGYTVLETQKQFKDRGSDYGFKVYCPFGDVWNGMVAINEKRKLYEVIILSPNNDTTKLEEALRRTSVINWSNSMMIVPFAPEHVIQCLERAISGWNLKSEYLPSELFLLEKNSPKFTDTSLPPNMRFGHLSVKHVDVINSSWPHRHPTSDWYFQLLIENNCGYGLYLNEELIAWLFVNECGNLSHMHTVQNHRRKGYAELLLKIVSNMMLDEGKDVFMYCVKGNDKACSLYRKMGFKTCEGVAWCFLNWSPPYHP